MELPKEVNYADYMLVGTCLSDKHLNASFLSLNKQYKHLLTSNSRKSAYVGNRIKLGKENKWCAVDLGAFVVHLFAGEQIRTYYNLETLWACGAEFDENLIEFKKQRDELEARLAYLEVSESRPNIGSNKTDISNKKNDFK